MTDFMTREQRSRAMSCVRGSETQLERLVRLELHKRGFRFRKNVRSLPGRPDIVLPKHKAVIFVHGCFWHGHQGCPASRLPDTNREFWEEKIGANVVRDAHQHEELRRLGWRIAVVWGCSLKNDSTQTITALAEWLVGTYKTIEL
jgi:DNA mismatch endonuclease (patch repair protein)